MIDPAFRQITYTRSVFSDLEMPEDEVAEVAISGRSNVGKSSLLNALGGSRKLARTSKQPGRTQAVNLFDFGGKARILDLPGYGYAKVSKSMRKDWAKLIEGALDRPNLCGVVALMDIRHPLTDADQQLLAFASGLKCELLPVLTKADKMSRGAGLNVIRKVSKALHGIEVMAVSAHGGQGVAELQEKIAAWVESRQSQSR